MIPNIRDRKWTGQLLLALVTSFMGLVSSQIQYSVQEELDHGAFVGNIAEDLGLDISRLSARRFRILSGAQKQYLEVNLENGILFVNEKIDREEVCEFSSVCSLHLQMVIENPLELYRVEVEILDINDNNPSFPWQDYVLEITESAAPGVRFPLEGAQDPDVGSNSLHTYKLSSNAYFSLEVQTRSDSSKFVELVLERSLDREQQRTHRLLLTAIDGGLPERSGSAMVTVSVLDANDNVPTFDQPSYRVSLQENAPKGTLVIKLNATDLDEGTNGEIEYSFSGHVSGKVRELFSVEPRSGQVRVKGVLDYEKAILHELYVQAKDRGPSAVAVHCRVLVELLDVNDNCPEVVLTSVSTPVQEDAPPGTVVAVISVMDRDSGENGEVTCEILKTVPFQLHSSFKDYYALMTTDYLDRELVSEYNITIHAQDFGIPSLITKKIISVQVSDINDSPPVFHHPSYSVSVLENNPPGASICSVVAQDADCNQNAYLSYSLLDEQIQGMPVSTYVSINSDSGNIYALRSFDYEQIRNFAIRVQAQDAGFPSLSSNVTVQVFIMDQNDNAPVIVSPRPKNGSVATEMIPWSVDPGYLVGKISAVDADAGQNSRLCYQILQATDPTLFSVALYTGELRTIRPFTDKDATKQRLVIQVRDNGQPSLSSTVSILLSVVDSVPEILPDFSDLSFSTASSSTLTLYLIVSLGSVSFSFLVAIIVLTVIKCQKDRHSRQNYSCSRPACCCVQPETSSSALKTSNINRQISSGNKVPTNCVDVGGSGPQTYCYKVCLTPESATSDFMFLKPCLPATLPNNEKIPKKVQIPGKNGENSLAINNSVSTGNQIKQPNIEWLPSKTQKSGLKSSQSLEDIGFGKSGNRNSDRLQTLVSPLPDFTKASRTPNSIWTHRYGPLCPSHIPPLDYQHNVYIPGSPTMLVSKQGLFCDQQDKNSFSTFGKKRKMTSCCDMHNDVIINNDLK
ncbi:protocadherin-10-like [Microcaecilia unicolor]|uniref:Protocadherin gamma-C3 n=1 Tax=Microcaecilia unicolor TaxID=1415580 RepID=A0A6P7YPT5_9AMPH|nr:protocadherin-10-like [Microcaecilia unicolor]